MPGPKTCLEELFCRVLGHLIEDGCVVKIANDLFCDGDSPEEVIHNWGHVLAALNEIYLRLTATKTVICPHSTTLFGSI